MEAAASRGEVEAEARRGEFEGVGMGRVIKEAREAIELSDLTRAQTASRSWSPPRVKKERKKKRICVLKLG